MNYTTGLRRCRLRGCVDAGSLRGRASPCVHPDRAANRKAEGDNLRAGKSSEEKTIILGADELDEEALYPRHYAVQSEQPALGVLVITQAPQNEKHDEAERDFVKLGRID